MKYVLAHADKNDSGIWLGGTLMTDINVILFQISFDRQTASLHIIVTFHHTLLVPCSDASETSKLYTVIIL